MMFNITITIRQTVEGGKYTNDIVDTLIVS